MQHGDGAAHEHAGDDVRFTQGAGPVLNEREQKPLEEGRRLVEGFLDGFVQVHVEFFGLVDVGANPVEEDGFEEGLRERGRRRCEDFGRFVVRVGRPRGRAGQG